MLNIKTKLQKRSLIKDLNQIKWTVQHYYNMDLTERNKRQENVYARFIYYKLARELTTFSYQVIGDSVKRNHCTVLHGEKEIINIFHFDNKILEDYKYLYDRLKPKEKRSDKQKRRDAVQQALRYRKKYFALLNMKLY